MIRRRWLISLFLVNISLLQAAADPVSHAKKALSSVYDTKLRKAIDLMEYKEAINELKLRVAKSPQADLYVALASVYLLDQQEEEAFGAFFQAIKCAKTSNKNSTRAEIALFDELLPLYLNGESLQEKLIQILEAHPDYLQIQFLLAASFANERKFENFFHLFYRSYLAHPNSYMAYKSQGVLASFLLQRVREFEQKQAWRKEALRCFKLACQEMPKDTGLHKMLIHTSAPEERAQMIRFIIEIVIQKEVLIPRAEIPFYVSEALAARDVPLARSFVNKATSWYQYSRIIEDMKRLIDMQEQ